MRARCIHGARRSASVLPSLPRAPAHPHTRTSGLAQPHHVSLFDAFLGYVLSLHSPLITDDTGELLTMSAHPSGLVRSTHLSTLFSSRRTAPYAPPLVDLTRGRGTVPAQPQPVALEPASVIGSWLGYFGVGAVSGEQIDALCKFHAFSPPSARVC